MAKAARYVFLLVLGFFAGVFFLQAQPADTMNREIYRFWETFQQLTGISYIMTYPTNFSNLPSNMTGAYGYWAGYGTATYSVNIPEEEEEP